MSFCKSFFNNFNTFFIIAVITFFVQLQFVDAQNVENQNENNVTNLQRFVTSNTISSQTMVEIKTEFSINTNTKEVIVNEIINNFSLTRNDTKTILKTVTNEKTFEEKFEVTVNSKNCVSRVTTILAFLVNSSDEEKILNEIVERSQLTSKQVNQSFEFEIDEVKLDVRVQNGKARAVMEYCDVKNRFVIDSDDEDTIISQISSKTGLRQYKIPLIWNFVTDVKVPEKKQLTLEEQKELAEKYGQEVFSNAEQQLQKAEKAQQLAAEGGEVPPVLTGGGGCLIATATYGTELAPQVQMLREIRDSSVLGTQSGAAFMSTFNSLYYSFSPTIADLERQNPVFREIVKITITPMISTLAILQYADIDSEAEILGYGIGIIALNVGMYVGIPLTVIVKITKKPSKKY